MLVFRQCCAFAPQTNVDAVRAIFAVSDERLWDLVGEASIALLFWAHNCGSHDNASRSAKG